MLLLTTSDSATGSEEIPHTIGTQLATFPGCKHVFLSRNQVLLPCSIGLMDIVAVIKYFSSHFFRLTMNFSGNIFTGFLCIPFSLLSEVLISSDLVTLLHLGPTMLRVLSGGLYLKCTRLSISSFSLLSQSQEFSLHPSLVLGNRGLFSTSLWLQWP